MDLFLAMSVYVKVVETGSLTAAARECALSTTMVGNHLRALEQRLGASLLNRTTRRQRLTEFGRAYYERCLEVLGLVRDSERLAEQEQGEPKGTLRITAPPSFGSECLAPALHLFSQQYPQIRLDVALGSPVVDLIENGVHVAIRLGTPEPSGLIARPLIDYTLTICASPAYLARHGVPTHPQDLSQHHCLTYAYPAGDEWSAVGKHWPLTGPEGQVHVPVTGPMVINSAPGLLQAARAGMGIVMLADALVQQDLRDGKLVALLQGYRLPSRPMNLIYAPDRYRLPKLRCFVEFALQRWGKPSR
ncbi:DNA-binding transcriptional regulator, LysR family [Pseudomonas sp. ok272]|uniref:LysR family transcriptional regulator n=1 Tax=unclassified Pseudomonas TaxID=196821 RepID=UPI0008BC861B|nr:MULTISPECIES: LysR family transcriptional regulator [unclassified Pseudomonas]SEN32044.1 DNA-binding transcriptional regulator, LysR family [Pseudomonas sp. ok272]SFN18847.1 DNA-binding transcriptional regulator, LysR family [Pseudomonas sp. ok602]